MSEDLKKEVESNQILQLEKDIIEEKNVDVDQNRKEEENDSEKTVLVVDERERTSKFEKFISILKNNWFFFF